MRILHVLNHNSPIFNKQLIELVNFNLNEEADNYFITFDEKMTNESNCNNICFFHDLARHIKENYKQYDYIFIHAMNFSIKDLFKFNKKCLKKFIWCVWGHDLYRNNTKSLKYKIRSYLLKDIYGVGIGLGYDAIEVRRFIGYNPKIFFLPYGYEKELIKNWGNLYKNKNEHDGVNILLGHSGYEFLNHIKNLDRLKKYSSKKIRVFIVLSYGNNEYIKEVEDFVRDKCNDLNIVIIKKMMSENEYMNFLSQMDIAIFDFNHQAALGNIWKLMFLGKKIYLSKEGILKKAFDLEGIETFSTNDIGRIDYNRFIEEIDNNSKEYNYYYAKKYMDDIKIVEYWKKIYDYLIEEKNE